MNLRYINLNLLKTLHVLFKTRSVSRTSHELFVSQPAVSIALKQLRVLFKDQLLTKGSNKVLVLTPKAQLIKPELEKILQQTLQLMDINKKPINFAHTHHIFRLGLQSHVSIDLLPKLNLQLTKLAPNIKIQHTQISDLFDLTPKELHKLDFIIGAFKEVPDFFCSEIYSKDKLICLSGIKKLNSQKRISVKDLNTYEHVLISYYNDYTRSLSEAVLKLNGIVRKHRLIVSDAFLAAKIAASESLLLILIDRGTELFTTFFALQRFELPFKTPELQTTLLYKESDKNNLIIQWFKKNFLNSFHSHC